MKKLFTRNTVNWCLGMIICTLGLCFSTKSNLGLSMIGACPYILHVRLSQTWAWFTQGTAEYVWEAIVLAVLCLAVRRFRPKYLLSFATAVLVGFMIDGWYLLLGGNGAYATMPGRIAAFAAGMIVTACGVAFFFRTTLPQEVYEMAVTELADRYHWSKDKTKFGFDVTMLLTALALSFLLTGTLTGIGIGTVVMTLFNAPLIAFFGRLIDRVER